MRRPPPSIDRLKELFICDPKNGVLTRRIAVNTVAAGAVVQSRDGSGYIKVVIDRRSCLAHRIIWAMSTGAWPAFCIDHINGQRTDNRLSNLREADALLNAQNVHSAKSSSRTGLLGVRINPHKGKGLPYQARIRVNSRILHLGVFKTAEEAHAAYVAAKRIHHPGCTL